MTKEAHPEDWAVEAAAERLVEQRLRQARYEEVMAIYEELFQTIWNRLVPTLGRVTVTAILERSIARTAERYPLVEELVVTRDGLSLHVLKQHQDNYEAKTVREAIKELVTNLIELLAVLTGDIIVRQLLKEAEGGQ